MTSCFGASWGRPFFLIHRDTPSDLQKKAQKMRKCPDKLFAQLDLREVSAFFAIFPSKVRLRLTQKSETYS